MCSTTGEITTAFLTDSTSLFHSDAKNVLAMNAITSTEWGTVVLNRQEVQQSNHHYSTKLKDMKITNQKNTGRCWIFAVLNLFRRQMVKEYNLADDFELSQPYVFFWDKLEKCNYFLENMLSTMDEPVDGRLIQHLLQDPTCDGGQWDMLVNVIQKYGVVPKSVYPESVTSSKSIYLNRLLKSKLREFAKALRSMHHSGKSEAQMRQEKGKMMQVIHRVMIIHLGEPPQQFDWTVHDKDKNFLAFRELTPQQFYTNHIKIDIGAYASLVHDPRNPYQRTLTVERLGNVVGGQDVLYVNLPMEDLIHYTKMALDNDEPVWFGCEVGKDFARKEGILSKTILDYEMVFNTKPLMSKKDRLIYGESLMTHAMLFTGYDKDEANPNVPKKWRVENSWGEDRGNKGYELMTDSWFREHMYQVVIKKSALSPEHLTLLEQAPIKLPAWDPMGSLARL